MSDKTVGIDGMGTKGSYKIGPDDQNLSIKHLKDRLEFNLRHAEDHLKLAKESCERLHNVGVEAPIPKSFLDLAEYFEAKSNYEETPDDKLKKHIKSTYMEKK